MKTRLVFENSKPILKTDAGQTPFCAYVTYFTENARYEDFSAAGYHLYSVCCYFTSLPINSVSGFTPARKNGIFDDKNVPDFSEFDEDVADLLEKDPNALFFPRIYLSMPEWWVEENPREVVSTVANPEGREMLFSDKFIESGAEMLKKFVFHAENASYADKLIGYQISGGSTQEWFHFDYNGSFCKNAYPYFCRYMSEKGRKNIDEEAFMRGEYGSEYASFANDSVADAIEYFCSVCKNAINREKIVGTFYGYSLENHDLYNTGGFSVNKLIGSENIDFFCSPFSYTDARTLDKDLSYMVAYGTAKLHGKAYILEADIRTNLTKYPDESRKYIKIKTLYRGADVWLGEKSTQESVFQLRRAAAKVLTGTGALWWFDMWGGWYRDERLMCEMRNIRNLFDLDFSVPLPTKMRAAIIIDEKLWGRHPVFSENIQREFCKRSYLSGVVSDIYLTFDVAAIADDYDVFFFPQPDPDRKTVEMLEKKGKTVRFGANMSIGDIIRACAKANVEPLCAPGDVVYEGNGIIALHAVEGGEKQITLPYGYTACALYNAENACFNAEVIKIDMEKHDTALFRVLKIG